jgi:hypothetical protein
MTPRSRRHPEGASPASAGEMVDHQAVIVWLARWVDTDGRLHVSFARSKSAAAGAAPASGDVRRVCICPLCQPEVFSELTRTAGLRTRDSTSKAASGRPTKRRANRRQSRKGRQRA